MNTQMIDHFNKLANSYDNLSFIKRHNVNSTIEIIKQIVPGLQTKKVIDIGCGTGRITLALSDIGVNVTGIDFSSEMIKKANSKKSGICYEQDYYRIEKQEKYNVVISMVGGVFGLINNKDLYINEINSFFHKLYDITTEDGIAVLEFLNGPSVYKHVQEEEINNKMFYPKEGLVNSQEGFYEKTFFPSEIECYAHYNGFSKCDFFAREDENTLIPYNIDEVVGVVKISR